VTERLWEGVKNVGRLKVREPIYNIRIRDPSQEGFSD
jgi:hypothetical protein